MKVKVQSLKPFRNIEGHFINIPDAPTFDPKHPSIYPGNEVAIKEILSPTEFLGKYGKKGLFSPDVLYTQSSQSILVLELTGRTSAGVVREL